MISQSQKQAAYDYLVLEMDAGRVGKHHYYIGNDPCCSMGHLYEFFEQVGVTEITEMGLVKASGSISSANDRGNFPLVLRLLRDAWGLEEGK